MTAVGADNSRWVVPAGSGDADGYDVVIDDRVPGWQHTALRVLRIDPGASLEFDTGTTEVVVVPLAGGVTVLDATGSEDDRAALFVLGGRTDPFAGATDVGYLPPGMTITLRNDAAHGDLPSRIALAGAEVPGGAQPSEAHQPPAAPYRLAADQVAIEQRGAGNCSRLVRNFGTPGVLDAQRIIACEVITPGGNWSSYPPHKHDEDEPGHQSNLEEIYYFEFQADSQAPAESEPFGFQQVYGTDGRPIDVLAAVGQGDVVLIPHGWHGPATAPPGYDMYYLNVMAGPGSERVWNIVDDPRHGWIRGRWNDQQIDGRLTAFGGGKQ